MRSTSLCAASAALLFGVGSEAGAQDTSTYVYDAQGRLVTNATAASSGNSTLSNYAYDDADSRTVYNSSPVASRPYAYYLLPGEMLLPSQAVVSVDAQSRLELRTNGSVVITCNGVDQQTIVGPNGEATQLVMQTDGNLVLYSYIPTALWATSGGGYPGAYLVLQDDGNAVIYYGSTPIWASSTFC